MATYNSPWGWYRANSGASLYNVVPTVIDLTDGSWTLYDPDSLIDTTYGTNGATFSGGFNTVRWNQLSVASLNYNWAAGGEHRAPRWYKAFDIEGNSVETGVIQIFQSIMEADLSVSNFNQQVVCGVAVDASTTSLFTVDGNGGLFSKTTTGNPAYGTWQYAAQTSGLSNATVKAYCTIQRGALIVGSGAYVGVNSSGVRTVDGSRNSNTTTAAGSTAQHLMVGFGTRSNTDTVQAGAQQRIKLSYLALTTGG